MRTRIHLGKENDSVADAIEREMGVHWIGVYWTTGQDKKDTCYEFEGKLDEEIVRKIKKAHPGIGEIEYLPG